jgi:hypothetical protein
MKRNISHVSNDELVNKKIKTSGMNDIIQWENGLKSSDEKEKHKSLSELRKYLFKSQESDKVDVKKVENFIQCPIIFETIVSILHKSTDDSILDSLNILLNVTASTIPHHTKFIIDLNLLPRLISLARNNKIDIKTDATWVLTNIASFSSEVCDYIIEVGIFDVLLDLCNNYDDVVCKSVCSHAFQVLNRYGTPSRLENHLMSIFPQLVKFLLFQQDKTILIHTCCCFKQIFLKHGNSSIINLIIEIINEQLITLSLHKDNAIAMGALNVIMEIVLMPKRRTTKFELKGIENALLPLINDSSDSKRKIRNKACKIMGDLVFEQIIIACNEKIIPPVIDLIWPYLFCQLLL